ncbi:MAG: hypothetical protein CSA21_06495 [Deltaproteobacteria bacterium]|nr:MAG: hypothetical protein CSA21_06495 [Deltaproteobacteria bacterium]
MKKKWMLRRVYEFFGGGGTCALMLLSLFFASTALAKNGDVRETFLGADLEQSAYISLGADGTVYILNQNATSQKGLLQAFSSTGDYLWKKKTASVDGPAACRLAVGSNGKIYVVGNEHDPSGPPTGNLQAFKADKSPEPLWSNNTTLYEGSLALGTGNSIYVYGWNTVIQPRTFSIEYFEDKATRKGSATFGGWAAGAFLDMSGNIYVGATHGYGSKAQCFNSTLGGKWNHDSLGLSFLIDGAMGAANSIHLIGKSDAKDLSTLITLNATGDKDETSSFDVTEEGQVLTGHSSFVVGNNENATFFVTGIVNNGTSTELFLKAFSSQGQEAWSNSTMGGSTLVLGKDKTLYCLSPEVNGTVWAIDSLTGEYQWSVTLTNNAVLLEDAVALDKDGTLYVVGDNGTARILYAIETASKGLADSPWPKVFNNNRNTSRRLVAEPSPEQPEGVKPPRVMSSTKDEKTKADLEKEYGSKDFTPYTELFSFKAEVTPDKISIFQFETDNLPAGKVSNLNCLKLVGKTRKYAKQYASNDNAAQAQDGDWWLVHGNGTYIGFNESLTAGTTYLVKLAIKDNGPYDEDTTNGTITDPFVLGKTAGGSGSGSGSSSGNDGSSGCSLNPGATFGLEWLLLAGVGLPWMRRRFRK